MYIMQAQSTVYVDNVVKLFLVESRKYLCIYLVVVIVTAIRYCHRSQPNRQPFSFARLYCFATERLNPSIAVSQARRWQEGLPSQKLRSLSLPTTRRW